jgi:hypothetical protein
MPKQTPRISRIKKYIKIRAIRGEFFVFQGWGDVGGEKTKAATDFTDLKYIKKFVEFVASSQPAQ